MKMMDLRKSVTSLLKGKNRSASKIAPCTFFQNIYFCVVIRSTIIVLSRRNITKAAKHQYQVKKKSSSDDIVKEVKQIIR